MARVKVYRYDYFDRLLKRDRRSVDYATADAIAAMGGTILAETMREIDDGIVPDSGVVRAADVPKAEIEAHEVQAPKTRPGETRMGTGR
ncbi:MAG TPA: hypothetical protein VFP44_03820 [Usitatibacter sp.]|nr:hypothetical protein [Usitatibacter sp.]